MSTREDTVSEPSYAPHKRKAEDSIESKPHTEFHLESSTSHSSDTSYASDIPLPWYSANVIDLQLRYHSPSTPSQYLDFGKN